MWQLREIFTFYNCTNKSNYLEETGWVDTEYKKHFSRLYCVLKIVNMSFKYCLVCVISCVYRYSDQFILRQHPFSNETALLLFILLRFVEKVRHEYWHETSQSPTVLAKSISLYNDDRSRFVHLPETIKFGLRKNVAINKMLSGPQHNSFLIAMLR